MAHPHIQRKLQTLWLSALHRRDAAKKAFDTANAELNVLQKLAYGRTIAGKRRRKR